MIREVEQRFKKYFQPLNIVTYLLEDDTDITDLMRSVFKENGLDNVQFFSKGKEFIDNLTEDVHIAIVDHYLNNGITGLDVLMKVNEVNPDCIKIAVSGVSDEKIIIEYINKGGVTHWVRKDNPAYPDELVKYINEIIPMIKKRFELMAFVLKGKKEWSF
jgi:response regulator RpfG family c-di-GMP phosphodiesterase